LQFSIFHDSLNAYMGKREHKIKEAKKDKTISFRIPNIFYEILNKLAQKKNQSINTWVRDRLMEYFYYSSDLERYEGLIKAYEHKLFLAEARRDMLENIKRYQTAIESRHTQLKAFNKELEEIEKTIKKLDTFMKSKWGKLEKRGRE